MSQFTHAMTKLKEARHLRDAALDALTVLEHSAGVGSAQAKGYDDETVGPLQEKVTAAEAKLRDAEPKTQREYLLKVQALLEEGMLSETVTALRADADRLAATGDDPVVVLCQRWKSMRTAVAAMLDEEHEEQGPIDGIEEPEDTLLPETGEPTKQEEFERLIAMLETGLDGEQLVAAEQRLAELEPEIQLLLERVESRRTWDFETPELRWQHDLLAELCAGLQRLELDQVSAESVAREDGWSVRKRLHFIHI